MCQNKKSSGISFEMKLSTTLLVSIAVGGTLVGLCVAWYVFWPLHNVWSCDQKCSQILVSKWRMWRNINNTNNSINNLYKTQTECQQDGSCLKPGHPPRPSTEPPAINNNNNNNNNNKIIEEKNVSYGPLPIHVMDMYHILPKTMLGSTPRRALVLVHGGGMIKGGKGEAREVSIARDMARVGFDVYVPSYTLGENSWPQNLDDITLAVRYVKKSDYGAPGANQVVLMGLSAGGTLALLCGIANPDVVSAVVSMYGITSPADRTYNEGHKFRPGHMHRVVGTSRCVSCRSKKVKHRRDARCAGNKNAHCLANVWLDVSPVEQLMRSRGKVNASLLPRFVLVHGDKDGIVNPEQANLFSEAHALVTRGGITASTTPAVRVIRVPNGQHGFDLWKNRDGTPLETAINTDLRRNILNSLS